MNKILLKDPNELTEMKTTTPEILQTHWAGGTAY